MNGMGTPKGDNYFLKLLIWFIFLSTLGVGGGIFFLIFAVVPIEQYYTDLGWSQFKIDSVMKYFVFGWVAFGITVSILYFIFVLKKNYWRIAIAGVTFTILLCAGGLYYFFNTGSGLVQSSQGEIVEGERFTFGPYPEGEQLKRIKAEGYDGVISLLNPVLPIEKPLLDKEISTADEIGLTVHSLPMLPWVGDNSATLDKIKDLINQDDKRYYVHCYLGKHRVDVVKQLVNETLGETIAVRFLQPTTLERGSLFYFPNKEIMMGPYPTDEEWFTRIKRGETEHILSLLDGRADSQWTEKEQRTTEDLKLKLTRSPLETPATIEDIRKVAEQAKALDGKVYIHNFINPIPILMLQAILSWDKSLTGETEITLSCGSPQFIGRKMMTGCTPNAADRKTLENVGIETFVNTKGMDTNTLYHAIQEATVSQQLTYWITNSASEQLRVARIAEGLLYGSLTRGEEFVDKKLETGSITKQERDLLVGPMFTTEEYETFAQANGVAHLIYLRSSSLDSQLSTEEIQELANKAGIPLSVIDLQDDYADSLLPSLEQQQGLTYIMTDASLIPEVNAYLKMY